MIHILFTFLYVFHVKTRVIAGFEVDNAFTCASLVIYIAYLLFTCCVSFFGLVYACFKFLHVLCLLYSLVYACLVFIYSSATLYYGCILVSDFYSDGDVDFLSLLINQRIGDSSPFFILFGFFIHSSS